MSLNAYLCTVRTVPMYEVQGLSFVTLTVKDTPVYYSTIIGNTCWIVRMNASIKNILFKTRGDRGYNRARTVFFYFHIIAKVV